MNNPDSYTPEDLAALPQTEAVFEPRPLDFDKHSWQQSGYMISDICTPSSAACPNVGIPIGAGRMLIKSKGAYKLVDEITRQ